MFYKYDERMNELKSISNIPCEEIKKKALKRFIEQEKEILNKLEQPQNRSQALDSAMRKLDRINTQQEVNPNIARKLF